MPITTNDLLNARVDLSDVLSWRAAQTPRFIRLFKTPPAGTGGAGRCATNTEHFWLEGVETPKTKPFSAYAYSDSTGAFTVADSSGWQTGDLFHILGDSAVLRVAATTATTVTPELVSANGSSFTLADYSAPDGGVLVFDSRPIQEGSSAGENLFAQSHTESNFTQIFRGDVELTGTAQAIDQAGMENALAVQLQYATDAIIRRMNAALIFGAKTRRTAAAPGSLGGLYYYGAQTGGLGRKYENSPALTMNMINLAAQDVTNAGCVPDAIVCGAGQAQVLSTMMSSQVQIPQGSATVGTYVDQFVTSAGGCVMKIVVEPSIPDGDVWVCDTRGFALVPLQGRALHTEPASAPGVDGSRAILIGEYTAEFKNAKESLCRISGLRPSEAVLGQ